MPLFANSSSVNGGAVYTKSDVVWIESSVFDSNSCVNYGGALLVDLQSQGNVSISLVNSTFRNNTAGFNGGVLRMFIATSSVLWSRVVYGLKCVLNITSSHFINSTVTRSTLLSNNHITSCIDCAFSGNTINSESATNFLTTLLFATRMAILNCLFSHNVIIQITTPNSTDSQLQLVSSSIDAQSVVNLTRTGNPTLNLFFA